MSVHRTTCPRCGQLLVAIGAPGGYAMRVWQCETPLRCKYFRVEDSPRSPRSALFCPPKTADHPRRRYTMRGEFTRKILEVLPTDEAQAVSSAAIAQQSGCAYKLTIVTLLHLARDRVALGVRRRPTGRIGGYRSPAWLYWRVA